MFEIDAIFASISGPIMLYNMLGPDIDSTLNQINATFRTFFVCFGFAETTLL